jgi:hypothetical protein
MVILCFVLIFLFHLSSFSVIYIPGRFMQKKNNIPFLGKKNPPVWAWPASSFSNDGP